MVRQYPHIITITPQPGDATYTNGTWVPQTPAADVQQPCRYEPSQITRQVEVADGLVVHYKGIAYLPLNTPDIAEGVIIKITDNSRTVVETKTVYFNRGQMNCMLYV